MHFQPAYTEAGPVTRFVGRLTTFVATSLIAAAGMAGDTPSAPPEEFGTLRAQYERDVRPLLKRYCMECHSTAKPQGELDLQRFVTLTEVRRGTKAWIKVAEMLDNGEMPPEDSQQPAPKERTTLSDWVDRYLHAEALASAGDPGPVVLRRLNNAEYTYTVRDLTEVDLHPAREFPSEGAAGEGFTNVGNALVMSPALLSKYLDAGREIASHAVLLPDGFRFSPQTTRRDWTDEILAQIREVYRPFVETDVLGTGARVGNINVHGNTRIGRIGRLPLTKYFAATLTERDALESGSTNIEAVARVRELNVRYLGTLWSSLTAPDSSLLLDDLRARWRTAKPGDAAALAADVTTWQKGLWMFGPVGLIGREGAPSRWMEPVSPLVTQQELRFKLPAPADGDDRNEIVISLRATDAGDGNEHDFVVFQQPRLVAEGKPDMLLRDARVDLNVRRPGIRGHLRTTAALTQRVTRHHDGLVKRPHGHGHFRHFIAHRVRQHSDLRRRPQDGDCAEHHHLGRHDRSCFI